VASNGINRVIGQIRRVAAEATFAALTDAELLGRYTDAREEAAFEALVRRHGPLVLGVCRRILVDAHAADDAFQATFFVLAKKARAIRKSESVASWLHGVARRVATRARESGRTRRWYERRWRQRPQADALQDVAWRDVGAILDEEIRRLPDRVRAPFVLCYLEGATNDAAARGLGCPAGTVMSRLSKAREILRARLTRRGLVLSAGFLAVTPSDAAVRVPVALADAACRTAAATGQSELVAPAVTALAAAVLRPSWPTAGMTGATGLLIAAVCAAGLAARGDDSARDAPAAIVAEAPKTDLELLQGTWALTASVYEGQSDAPETTRGAKATVVGDVFSMIGPLAPPRRMNITLDPTANPKTIDMALSDGPAKGMTTPGIYQIDGDTLQICVPAVISRIVHGFGPQTAKAEPQTLRPTVLAAPRGSLCRLYTLKRAPSEP
jgi:RNA polymerase sigma factor (sigma-70 family)